MVECNSIECSMMSAVSVVKSRECSGVQGSKYSGVQFVPQSLKFSADQKRQLKLENQK